MRVVKHTYLLLLILLLSFAVVALLGCSKEVPKGKTYKRGGVLYEVGNTEPFTGYVVGKGREGYRAKAFKYRKQYKNGLLNGKTKFWYKNGNLESVEPYRNGKINGLVARYYEDGQIKTYIHLVDGERGGYKGEMFWSGDGKKEK